MKLGLQISLLLSIFFILEANAVADVNKTSDGDYQIIHDDISTIGTPTKENLKPKLVPEPDLDSTRPVDEKLIQKIENGTSMQGTVNQ